MGDGCGGPDPRAGPGSRGRAHQGRRADWGAASAERVMPSLSDRPSWAGWCGPAERLRSSVAQIVTGTNGRGGIGAAIAWSDGLFVTSAHVIRSPRMTVVTPDGRRVPGELVWQQRRRDVALVRAPGAAMPPVRTADPSAMRPGSLVMAIGHPFGLVDAVSTGVLQSVGELPPELDFEGGRLRWV